MFDGRGPNLIEEQLMPQGLSCEVIFMYLKWGKVDTLKAVVEKEVSRSEFLVRRGVRDMGIRLCSYALAYATSPC